MKKTIILGMILVAILACVGAVSAAELVTNGGFESPVAANPFTANMVSGLTGWTIDSGNVDLIKEYWVPFEGKQSLDLSGDVRGEISQPISGPPGSYTLTFEMSGNNECSPTIKELEVYWGAGPSIASPTFDTSVITNKLTDMHYTQVSVPITLTTSPTVLKFEDDSVVQDGEERCGVVLDAISIKTPDIPVPEFPTMALPAALIVGLLGAVLFIQSTKKN
jgi:hypothetical protein